MRTVGVGLNGQLVTAWIQLSNSPSSGKSGVSAGYIEAFQDLGRRASIEKDPAKLEELKKALRFMLQSEGIEMERLEKKPSIKPN